MTSAELKLYQRGGAAAMAAEADRQLSAHRARSRRTAERRAPGKAQKLAKREAEDRREAEGKAAARRRSGVSSSCSSSSAVVRVISPPSKARWLPWYSKDRNGSN